MKDIIIRLNQSINNKKCKLPKYIQISKNMKSIKKYTKKITKINKNNQTRFNSSLNKNTIAMNKEFSNKKIIIY